MIKFLAGFLVIDFIRKIYSEKDNVIHSRLFLAIECVGEIKEKEGEIDGNLSVEIIRQLMTLLHDKDRGICYKAANALGKISRDLPVGIINQLVSLLCDHNSTVRYNAATVLGEMIDTIPENLIREIEKYLNDESYHLLKQLYASGKKLSES